MQQDVSESETHQLLLQVVSGALGLPASELQLMDVSKNPVKGIPADQHPPQADAKAVHVSMALVMGRGQPVGLQEGGQLLKGHEISCAPMCASCSCSQATHM